MCNATRTSIVGKICWTTKIWRVNNGVSQSCPRITISLFILTFEIRNYGIVSQIKVWKRKSTKHVLFSCKNKWIQSVISTQTCVKLTELDKTKRRLSSFLFRIRYYILVCWFDEWKKRIWNCNSMRATFTCNLLWVNTFLNEIFKWNGNI